jgi:hypothetical protein
MMHTESAYPDLGEAPNRVVGIGALLGVEHANPSEPVGMRGETLAKVFVMRGEWYEHGLVYVVCIHRRQEVLYIAPILPDTWDAPSADSARSRLERCERDCQGRLQRSLLYVTRCLMKSSHLACTEERRLAPPQRSSETAHSLTCLSRVLQRRSAERYGRRSLGWLREPSDR